MNSQTHCFHLFMEKWTHPDYRPAPLTNEEIDRLEIALGARLPVSYRSFLVQYGPAHTILALLSNIVEQSLALSDLSELLSPEEVIESTNTHKQFGLPEDCIAIARDCCGNLFCFKTTDLGLPAPEDAAVWFFDHDFVETRQVFPSFSEWIGQLAEVEKVAT